MATVIFIIAALTLGANVFYYHQNPGKSWPVDIFQVCVAVDLMALTGIINCHGRL